jgi:hypothetical protein
MVKRIDLNSYWSGARLQADAAFPAARSRKLKGEISPAFKVTGHSCLATFRNQV